MKKMILFTALALLFLALPCQEQELPPVQAQEQPQVQAEEPPQTQAEEPPAPLQGRDLGKVRFPAAFIHAGKEYPAGDYWLFLTAKDGRSMFVVQDAQKTLLFEDLAIIKPGGYRGGRGFHVDINRMRDREYIRLKITMPGEWALGYFLLKK
ncbi:MAG: hypothetical protein MUC72_02000 [Acidobacteria bacterium]|jgi:hypothetical protein|nr:hypothetical protein [Acidobacteriota bacterium]